MTVAQTVVMISIGAIIIQPIIEDSIWRTVGAAMIFILILILFEWIQVKSNTLEKLITGKSQVVILNGQIQYDKLKKLRFTVDQLELRLRQNGISSFADVKIGTLEANGQLGYEFMPKAKPVTVGDLENILGKALITHEEKPPSVFEEVLKEKHENPNPDDVK